MPLSAGPTASSPAALPASGTPGPLVSGPRVSVVIPLYNHEKYIEAAIHSVLSQTTPAAEIIVIDDGSTDGSADKVRQLCQDHPEIIFWSWPNQGAHHTLNAGILRATGDFVAVLNSDDCYEPERLAACLAVVRSDASVDVVATGTSFVDEQGRTAANPWYDDALAFYKQEGDLALALFHANFLVTTSNLFIRRSLFEAIGYFSPLRYTHDLEFFLRLILAKKAVHFLDRPLVTYRLHDKNTISENKAREDVERATVFAFFLYRQWRGEAANGTLGSALERYVEVLAHQGMATLVEDFLALLEGKLQQEGSAAAGPLATEFLGFLSRLGVDWVARGSDDPLLARFVSARNAFLHRQEEAGGDTKLIGKLKADNAWLSGQRDAWEKTARTREEQLKALEEQAKSSAEALEAMRAGKAWLLGQRDAWEQAATKSGEELGRFHAAINDLQSNRLFRLLVRAKLLELKHLPPGSAAAD